MAQTYKVPQHERKALLINVRDDMGSGSRTGRSAEAEYQMQYGGDLSCLRAYDIHPSTVDQTFLDMYSETRPGRWVRNCIALLSSAQVVMPAPHRPHDPQLDPTELIFDCHISNFKYC